MSSKKLWLQCILNLGISIGQSKDQRKLFNDWSKQYGPTVDLYDGLTWYKNKF